MKKFWFRKGLLFIVMIFAATLLFGAIVMGLWNAVLSPVIGVSKITFWQGLGILILSKILFGGFGRRGGWNRGGHPGWRKKMQEKWTNMTPEEKEKFRSEWKNRCGPGWKERMQNSGYATDTPTE
ncbi:MAG: hypothetical protein ABI683_05300 [Ginsengibacter sp.]